MAQYIYKDAVVAEIESLRCTSFTNFDEGVNATVQTLLETLDTIEVKEVDLDGEYIEEVYSHIDSIKDTADRMTSGNYMHNRAAIKFSANTIAKVLELMGLKAQKGE